MTIRKIYVPLDVKERMALAKLAERKRRTPRDQAAVLIREALEAIGLLEPVAAQGDGHERN